jgi:hypothetical protein
MYIRGLFECSSGEHPGSHVVQKGFGLTTIHDEYVDVSIRVVSVG